MGLDQWGRCYFNPDWVRQYTVAEIAVALLHELFHKLRNHHLRAKARGVTRATFELANIAMDCEINDDLSEDNKRENDLPPIPASKDPGVLAFPESMRGPWFPWKIGCEDGNTWESYYDHLLDLQGASSGNKDDERAKHGGGGQSPLGKGEEKDGKERHFVPGGSAAHGIQMPWEYGNPSEQGQPEGIEDGDWQDIKRLTAKAIREAKGRGIDPGEWVSWSDDILEPVHVSWEDELSSGLRWAMNDVSGMAVYSYKRPSRRSSSLPEFIMPSMRKPIPFVCIVGDTSGSMNELHDLPLLRGTVSDVCIAAGAQVAFLATDAQVHGGTQMLAGTDLPLLHGRGGTDMCAGIQYAVEELLPSPDVILVMTDCETGWPAMEPPVRVIVCAIGANERSMKNVPKWAQVIEITAKDTKANHED